MLGLTLAASGSAYADDVDPFAVDPAPVGDPAPEPLPEPEPVPTFSGEVTTETPPEHPPWHHGSGIVIGLKVGGAFAGVFNDFGAAFVPELELGWMLPFADRMLEVFVSGRWSAPTTSGVVGPDARLPGDGMMSYNVEQQTAAIGLGLRLRIDVSEIFSPYLAAGGRVNLMRSYTNGEAGGQPFGENTETSTNWGFFGALGGEIHVGPGAILLEVQANQVSTNHFVLQDTNLSSLDIFAGYRFMF